MVDTKRYTMGDRIETYSNHTEVNCGDLRCSTR